LEFLSEYGMFLAKTATLVVAVLVVTGGIVMLARRGEGRPESRGRLDIRHLNGTYDDMAFALKAAILPKKGFKQFRKERKTREKQREKTERRRVFVLNFHGDIRASALTSLREEVTAVLTVAQPEDEVVLRLESAGGLVHAYGLAAAQLLRIRDRRIELTAAVDKVAAERRLHDGLRGRPHHRRAVRRARFDWRHRPVAEFQPAAQETRCRL
jgi:inner membrane peptidase. Serine peptidase. MEROPS family S49